MKERPIIFNGEMVRAILDGRKTQTRRVIKGQANGRQFVGLKDYLGYPASRGYTYAGFGNEDDPVYIKCPYGQPGDRLYVRETWCNLRDPEYGYQLNEDAIIYRANGDDITVRIGEWSEKINPNWRPSIHMPKWAARIWLEITDVRVERVQDISDGDVAKEGVEWSYHGILGNSNGSPARDAFYTLWNSINAKRGYGWDANPCVWVVTFRRIDNN